MKKVRACHLEVNDIFIKQNAEYIVVAIYDGKIFYRLSSVGSRRGEKDYIGSNSQEWVLLVGKYVTKTKADVVPDILVKTVNGDFVGVFRTQKEATKKLKLSQQHISRIFAKKTRNGACGYIFERI